MKVLITKYFEAFGLQFEGIKEGQVHTVLEDDGLNVWIQGNGEPIKLLESEFKIFEE